MTLTTPLPEEGRTFSGTEDLRLVGTIAAQGSS
jgi:hypothetical protein